MDKDVTLFASAAQTATVNSVDVTKPIGAAGLLLILNISAVSGSTPTLNVKLQSKDPISGNYVDVPGAAFAQQNSTGTLQLVVHPAVAAVANVAIAQGVGHTFRAVATIAGGTPSFTFSLSGHYLN